MKKAYFFSALVLLVLANIFVYACKKENVAPAPITTSTLENVAAGERNATCPQINFGRGAGLTICGIDSGSSCSLCNTSLSLGAPLSGTSLNSFPFSGSTFSLTNTTGASINVSVSFNCGSPTVTMLTIPAMSTVTYIVTVVNGCCEVAVLPC